LTRSVEIRWVSIDVLRREYRLIRDKYTHPRIAEDVWVLPDVFGLTCPELGSTAVLLLLVGLRLRTGQSFR